MTKVTILGESHEDVKPKKKIEFVKSMVDGEICDVPAEMYDYIELICRNFKNSKLDLMFCYHEDCRNHESNGLFLGHFNDGVV